MKNKKILVAVLFLSLFIFCRPIFASEVTGNLGAGIVGGACGCSIDEDLSYDNNGGCICTPKPTPTTTPSSFTNSSPSSSANHNESKSAPTCGDTKPSSNPDLFQINVKNTTAQLFFTPISNTQRYNISYSLKPNAEDYGTETTLSTEGVQNYTVNLLSPNTPYYFKVRGQIGCMPGDWSDIMKVTTQSKGILNATPFYKYVKNKK